MSKRKDKDDDLDTQTTFANMNVEGFKWYDPSKNDESDEKKQKKVNRGVSRKEYFNILRGVVSAMLPSIIIFLLSITVVALLLYLWLT